MNTVDISVIIPCFNAEKFIEKCINSINEASPQPKEIIIIDDNSTDNSRKILSRLRKKGLKVIFSPKNLGPAIARNNGVKIADGKYLSFLDIDTTVDQKIFEEIYKKMESDSTIGALQGKIINAKTKKLETAGHFLAFNGFPYEIGTNENPNKFNQEIEIFGARSACLAIRSDVFKKIGGFDEDYFIYGEETDLCWRTQLAGYRIIFFPKAIAHHFSKSTLNPKTKYRVLYEGAKNNTANILKNARLSFLLPMITLHLLTWFLVYLKLIINRDKTGVFILRGVKWNIVNLSRIIKKRKENYINHNGETKTKNIFGPISFDKIIKKALLWLKNL